MEEGRPRIRRIIIDNKFLDEPSGKAERHELNRFIERER